MSEWKRPGTIPFPSIWRKFEGKKKVNGVAKKYWVQDVTEDLKNPVIEAMCTDFVKEEALCRFSGATNEPQVIEGLTQIFIKCCDERLALVCLTTNENGETEIAGVNMTYRSYKGEEPHDEPKSETGSKIVGAIKYINDKANIFEKFKLDDYLSAVGLFVLPKFREEGIGVEILKSRRELCLAVGLNATFTLFTSLTSQAVARKAGFQELVDTPFEELEAYNPEFVFPGIKEVSNSSKYMYIIF